MRRSEYEDGALIVLPMRTNPGRPNLLKLPRTQDVGLTAIRFAAVELYPIRLPASLMPGAPLYMENQSHALICALVRPSFFFSSRRRHTRFDCDWSSDVCSSD